MPTYHVSHTGDSTREKTVRVPALMERSVRPITDKEAILFQRASATLADIRVAEEKHIKGI